MVLASSPKVIGTITIDSSSSMKLILDNGGVVTGSSHPIYLIYVDFTFFFADEDRKFLTRR